MSRTAVQKRAYTVWLALLFAVSIARLWLISLPSSFWVDETVTAFVVEHPHHPSLAVAPQVPASLYYWLPRLWVHLAGRSEASYRIPSVLAMLAAIWMVSLIAARLIHPNARWFAAFACLAMRGIDYYAVDARPYALGILMAAAAVWTLVRWLDRARWLDAAAFALCAALVWRIHLIYWPFYLVLALYAALRLSLGQTRVGWAPAAAVFALIGISLLPVAVQALAIHREAAAHVIVKPPTWRDFLHLLRWNLVLIAGVGAWILRKLTRIGFRDIVADANVSSALVLTWWLVPPVVLYAVSVASAESVYLTRYLSLALPATALAATVAASRFLPAARWPLAAALMGIGALAAHGQWAELWPPHEKSNWRAAAAEINRAETGSAVPVICPSPFIEARPGVWSPGYPLPGFLYAHLAYYPVRGPLLLFPYQYPPEAFTDARQLLAGQLTSPGEFFIYGGAGNARFWQKWFAAQPELGTWRNRRDEFGDVYVVHFWASR